MTPSSLGKLRDRLPDVRDGLTRLERVILHELHLAEHEQAQRTGTRGKRIATAMLYGRVVEHVNVSVQEFQAALTRLVGR